MAGDKTPFGVGSCRYAYHFYDDTDDDYDCDDEDDDGDYFNLNEIYRIKLHAKKMAFLLTPPNCHC